MNIKDSVKKPTLISERIIYRFIEEGQATQKGIEDFVATELGDCVSLVALRAIGGTLDYPALPIMSNTPYMAHVAKELCKALQRRIIDQPDCEVALVTLQLSDFETTIEGTTLELGLAKKQLKATWSAMADNFIGNAGCFKCEPFCAAPGGHGARHFGRGIIFGRDIRGRAEMAIRKRGYHHLGAGGAPGVDIRWLSRKHLDRDLAISTTRMCRIAEIAESSGAHGDVALPYDRLIISARCSEVKALLRTPKVIVSKGQGKAVAAEVIEEGKAWLQKGKGDRRRVVHPDEVLHRFYDLWQGLGVQFRPVLIKN